jgi:hypothetical protein
LFQDFESGFSSTDKGYVSGRNKLERSSSKYWTQAVGNKPFFAMDGQRMTLRGPGYALDSSGNPTIKTVGIVFGNDVPCELDVRNLMICDMKIMGFHTSHRWGLITPSCAVSGIVISLAAITEWKCQKHSTISAKICAMKTAPSAILRMMPSGLREEGVHPRCGTDVDFVGRHMLRIGPLSRLNLNMFQGT